jgi:uncharacterized alkaline shock family protein YloU
MSGFNRFVMLIIALLTVVVPALVLLVFFGVLSGQQLGLGSITGALSGLPEANLTSQTARTILGVVGALLLLVALILILRELVFGRPAARKVTVQDEPGKETVLTAQAVRHLAEAAAREAGAVSPTVKLTKKRDRYDVACNVEASTGANIAEMATRTRENVAQVLEEQRVPVDDVEVMVRETASQKDTRSDRESGLGGNNSSSRQGVALEKGRAS